MLAPRSFTVEERQPHRTSRKPSPNRQISLALDAKEKSDIQSGSDFQLAQSRSPLRHMTGSLRLSREKFRAGRRSSRVAMASTQTFRGLEKGNLETARSRPQAVVVKPDDRHRPKLPQGVDRDLLKIFRKLDRDVNSALSAPHSNRFSRAACWPSFQPRASAGGFRRPPQIR